MPSNVLGDPIAIGSGTVTLNSGNVTYHDVDPWVEASGYENGIISTWEYANGRECLYLLGGDGNSKAYWDVTIQSGNYDVEMHYGTAMYGITAKFNIIDPSNSGELTLLYNQPYKGAPVNQTISDNFSLTTDGTKTYRVQAINMYPGGGSHFVVEYIKFTRTDGCVTPDVATFAKGDAESGSVSNIEMCAGSEFPMPNQGSMLKPGYLFTGWKLNNTGDLITAGTFYTMPAGGASFTAQWEVDNTTLRIPGSGSILNASNYSVLGGSAARYNDKDIDQDGNNDDYLWLQYGDAQWEVYITPGSYSVTTTCCVFTWGIHARVTLIDPLGIETTRVIYDTGNLGGSQNVYKSGTGTVEFSGSTAGKRYIVKVEDFWDGNSRGGCHLSFKDIVFTPLGANRDITFAKGDASVTGTLPSNTSCAADGTYELPGKGDLAWSGHTFAGWNDGSTTYAAGASYTMPNHDVTFTAVWNPIVVPAVSNLALDNPFNSNIPLKWNIPGICDLSNPKTPLHNMDGANTTSKKYEPEGDDVKVTGTMEQYKQFGVAFDIPATTGIEWVSYDFKGTLGSGDHVWGGVDDGSYTYWHFVDPMPDSKIVTSSWQNSGQEYVNRGYWDATNILPNPLSQSCTQVAIYGNTAIGEGSFGTFYVRNVRYHVSTWDVDVDHVVLMRKVGSAATGIDDTGATQLFSGTKSHFTDSEAKTVGETYYYTIFAVDADGNVSAATTITKTITDDTPRNVTYANGNASATGTVPTDGTDYTTGASVIVAVLGDLALEGHSFIGWSDGENVYAPGDSYTMPDHDVTFTAQWLDTETPSLLPATILNASNVYIPTSPGTDNFDIDDDGSPDECVDIKYHGVAEWKVKFQKGHYKVVLNYGTPAGGVNVTLKILDGEADLFTMNDVHSGDGKKSYNPSQSVDLTGIDESKVYIVKVLDTYGLPDDATSKPKVGSIEFSIITPTPISSDSETKLNYSNVTINPGTVEFSVKNDGNSATCLDIKDQNSAEWYVTLVRGFYNINLLYGTPEYSTNVAFSIIDPENDENIFAPDALSHTGSGGTHWYESKTWNLVDLTNVTEGKQYIVKVKDNYSSKGSKPKVESVIFTPHHPIEISTDPVALNSGNTISSGISKATDLDIDGDGNNDECMNLRNSSAEWDVIITPDVYTIAFEYGVTGGSCKVTIELEDPLGEEETRQLLYHALSNSIESGVKARIANRGCDFSDVTPNKRYIIRVKDSYTGCNLRVRNLSFKPYENIQISNGACLSANNVFTPNIRSYKNFDVDGDSQNDECLYVRNQDDTGYGIGPVDWKVSIEPGIYKMTAVYGVQGSASYDITISLIDPEVGGEGTMLYTKHVSSTTGIFRQNETTTLDWTGLSADKQYIIRVASISGNSTGNKLYFGRIDFVPQLTHTRSGLRIGDYGTICLPYAVAAANRTGAELFEIESWAENGTSMTMTQLNADEPMTAGRPYIFQATANTATFSYYVDGDETPAGTHNGLIGSYVEAQIQENDNNYIIYNNKLYMVNSANVWVGANRAYIYRGGEYSPAPANRRRVTMGLYGTQTTTDINQISTEQITNKVIRNGHLFILRGDKIYNAQGQLVQ